MSIRPQLYNGWWSPYIRIWYTNQPDGVGWFVTSTCFNPPRLVHIPGPYGFIYISIFPIYYDSYCLNTSSYKHENIRLWYVFNQHFWKPAIVKTASTGWCKHGECSYFMPWNHGNLMVYYKRYYQIEHLRKKKT